MKILIRICLSVFVTVFALVLLKNVLGRHKVVSSIRRFERSLEQDLTVALLYVGKYGDKEQKKQLKPKIKNLLKTFKRVSRDDPFHYVEMLFIRADISKSKLESIPQDYGLPRPTIGNPIIVLFKGGKHIATANGFVTGLALKSFIQKHFGKEMDIISKQKDARRQRRIEEARRRAYNRAYSWPYYGYGWGGGWGWPYYRSYGWGWRGYGHRRGFW